MRTKKKSSKTEGKKQDQKESSQVETVDNGEQVKTGIPVEGDDERGGLKFESVQEKVRMDFVTEQIADFGRELGELAQKYARTEAEKKSEAAKYDADLKENKIRQGRLVELIHDGFEMRELTCYKVYDFEKGEVHFFRADVWGRKELAAFADIETLFAFIEVADGPKGEEPCKTRRMKSWERQQRFDFDYSKGGDDEMTVDMPDGQGEQLE